MRNWRISKFGIGVPSVAVLGWIPYVNGIQSLHLNVLDVILSLTGILAFHIRFILK